MNITKEGDDYKQVKQLEELDKEIKDNPCDMCTLKYIEPEACLTCNINFE